MKYSRLRCCGSVAGVLALCMTILTACGPAEEDFDIYQNIATYALQKYVAAGAVVRSDITDQFNDLDGSDYILRLKGLIRLVFGAPRLEVHLSSYTGQRIAVASVSQFEVPPNSGVFTDAAFTVRPDADVRAPILHGDAVKGMGGMDSSFSIDFYNVNPDYIRINKFFGDQIDKIEQALALVEPYQRQGEDRGKYIEHIAEYSTADLRIEIDESYIPEGVTREQYYSDMLTACQLYMDAYFTALERRTIESNADMRQKNIAGQEAFMDALYENDFAAQMGRVLFGDDFDAYYLDGFWRYLEGGFDGP